MMAQAPPSAASAFMRTLSRRLHLSFTVYQDAALDALDALLIKRGTGGANALIAHGRFEHTSDQNGRFLVMQFQVENSTDEVYNILKKD